MHWPVWIIWSESQISSTEHEVHKINWCHNYIPHLPGININKNKKNNNNIHKNFIFMYLIINLSRLDECFTQSNNNSTIIIITFIRYN